MSESYPSAMFVLDADALAQCRRDLAEALQHADILAAELAHSLRAFHALQADRQRLEEACWALIMDKEAS